MITAERSEVMVISFPVTQQAIEETRDHYASLTCDTPEGYEEVRLAIREVVSTRTSIERRRKELNEDAVKWKRKVDAGASLLTSLILEIEEPLKAKKQAVDDARAEAKRAEEDRERERMRLLTEAKIKEQQEANRLERERLEAERLEMSRRQEEDRRLQAEARAKMDAERQELAKQQEAMAAKQAQAKAKEDSARRAEQRRIEAEEKARRMEQLKPDAERLWDWAKVISNIKRPEVTSAEALAVVSQAEAAISDLISFLDSFGR